MTYFKQTKRCKLTLIISLIAIIVLIFFLFNRTLAGQVTPPLVADYWSSEAILE